MQKEVTGKIYRGEHAVVIGGSMAGLITAKVLTDHFERVTIIERDILPQAVQFRSGVPQARHPHLLLMRGLLILEQLFPGLESELKAAGAVTFHYGTEFPIHRMGSFRPSYHSEVYTVSCSRPLLEGAVRGCLIANPEITILEGCEVVALQTDEARGKVSGVQIRSRSGSQELIDLKADLVVDASGRESHAPNWLEGLGYAPPQETNINSYPGYATRIYQSHGDFEWKAIYLQPSPPQGTRGAILLPLEGGRWHVTMIGMAKDYPPMEEEGFLEFARSLPSPIIYDAIKHAKPLTSIYGFRRGDNRLRHYDRMADYLEGFVVLGDAVFAFDPIYGQGMSVAAMSAMELGQCLSEFESAELPPNFQQRLAQVLAFPWQMAAGQDMRWEVEGMVKPTLDPEAQAKDQYMSKVMMAGGCNVVIAEAIAKVINLVEPPSSLFQPHIMKLVEEAAMAGFAN